MAVAPGSTSDPLQVVFAADGRGHLTRIDHWAAKGELLPVAGDVALVASDDEGRLWITEWVPYGEAPDPGALPIGSGGTGAETAAGARANLGVHSYVGQLIWSALTLNDEPTLLPCDGRGITSAMAFPLLRARLIASSYPYGFDGSGNPRIPDYRDRALVGSGPAHGVGHAFGYETFSLAINQMPSHSHSGTATSAGAHTHNLGGSSTNNGTVVTTDWSNAAGHIGWGGVLGRLVFQGAYHEYIYATSAGAHTHTLSISAQGGTVPLQNTQPSLASYAYIVATVPE